MHDLELKLTIEEVNLVLEGLGNLPFARVYTLVAKVRDQASRQIQRDGASAAGGDGAPREAAGAVNSHG
jgi:hypothetical protein